MRALQRRIGPLVLILVAACSSAPVLVEPPQRFDIDGQWALNTELSDPPPNSREILARADQEFVAGRVGVPQGGALAFVTQDFPVLEARSMHIEQDDDSMGIRYDNGLYRDVSWGKRKRGLWDVSAGWFEGNLVIVSKTSDASGRETLSLSANGQTLKILVEANSDGEKLIAFRVFERVPAP